MSTRFSSEKPRENEACKMMHVETKTADHSSSGAVWVFFFLALARRSFS